MFNFKDKNKPERQKSRGNWVFAVIDICPDCGSEVECFSEYEDTDAQGQACTRQEFACTCGKTWTNTKYNLIAIKKDDGGNNENDVQGWFFEIK